MINISQCNAPLGFSVGNKSQIETECSLTSVDRPWCATQTIGQKSRIGNDWYDMGAWQNRRVSQSARIAKKIQHTLQVSSHECLFCLSLSLHLVFLSHFCLCFLCLFVFASCLSYSFLSLHLVFLSLFYLCILVFFVFVSCLCLQLSSPWTLGCPAADPPPLQSCSKPLSPSQDHSVFKRFLHKIMAKCISGSFFPFSLHVCFFMQKYLFCSKPPSPSQDHSQALLLLQRSFSLDHGKCIFGNCL